MPFTSHKIFFSPIAEIPCKLRQGWEGIFRNPGTCNFLPHACLVFCRGLQFLLAVLSRILFWWDLCFQASSRLGHGILWHLACAVLRARKPLALPPSSYPIQKWGRHHPVGGRRWVMGEEEGSILCSRDLWPATWDSIPQESNHHCYFHWVRQHGEPPLRTKIRQTYNANGRWLPGTSGWEVGPHMLPLSLKGAIPAA